MYQHYDDNVKYGSVASFLLKDLAHLPPMAAGIIGVTLSKLSRGEASAVKDEGPSALVSPEALIGGLGGSAVGGLGTYGISKLLGRENTRKDALYGALAGGLLGHFGGMVTHSIR